jgi:transcriptional regulator with XRE-family HTH domain
VPKLGTHEHQVRRMISKCLDAATPSLRGVAHVAGISYSAIRQYQKGKRTPAPAVLRRLARALRTQGGKLGRLADQLEAAAGRR